MADVDPYSLLMSDEPTAQEQARAYAAALRGQRSAATAQGQLGTLSEMTGDSVIGRGGAALAQNAEQQLGEADKGDSRLGQLLENRLQRQTQAKHYEALEDWYNQRAQNQSDNLSLQAQRLQRPDVGVIPGTTTLYNKHGAASQGSVLHGGGSGGASGASSTGLSEEALDALADQYALNGALPQMGRGPQNTAIRTEVVNRAMRRHQGTDLTGNKADFEANNHALANLTKLNSVLDAFESTGGKNLDRMMELAPKIPDFGNQTINSLVRNISNKSGSPEMSAFRAAHAAATAEIGKILSGASGGGAMSDSARAEAEHLLDPNSTLPQLVASAKVIRQDMLSRRQANEETLAGLRAKLSSRPHPAASGVADHDAAAAWLRDPANKSNPHYAAVAAAYAKAHPGT